MKGFHSIRWRIQLWYGIMFVAVLAGLGVTAFTLQRSKVYRQIDNELMRRAQAVGAALRTPEPRGQRRSSARANEANPAPREEDAGPDRRAPAGFRLLPRDDALFGPADAAGHYFVAYSHDGHEIARSPNAPPVAFDPNQASRPGQAQVPPAMRGAIREVHFETGAGDHIFVGRNIAAQRSELRVIALELAAVGVGILLIVMAGGWWITNRSLRPIRVISSAAAKISSGNLAERIDVAETESELGQLAAVLNSTFARLDAAFGQQQQFASDVAHELRTPVSVLLTQTQSTLQRERTTAEYRDALAACDRAAQRMRRLIESLLELARFDAGQEVLHRRRFDLAARAAESLDLVRPLADEAGVSLASDVPPLEITADPDRLGQVLTNLLTNAIQYNRRGGEVRLTARRDEGLVVVEVADNGPGIAPADLPRVFERFYRGDKNRAGGHAGLGLAICKALVEAHGGTLQAESDLGRGSRFKVHLPA